MNQNTQDSPPNLKTRPAMATVILIGGVFAIAFSIGLFISVGAANIHLATVWEALVHYNNQSTQDDIIRNLRLPRALADVMVGACFAVAGAIMQGLTRNPLADSGLLGLNSGAALMLAICFAFMPGISYNMLILLSFLGAAASSVFVFGVGSLSKSGMTPTRLILAGAAVTALFSALSEAIAIHFKLSQDLAFWYAGGVAGVKWHQLHIMWPWMTAALICAVLLSKSITLLSLGEEVAVGLGQRTKWVKLASVATVLILAGLAVSAVGPVGFIGLVVPHLTRYLVGVDYRWIIPCSAIIGALLTLYADIGARTIDPPYETPISVIFALIGVPFFLYVARQGRRELQ